MALVVLSKRVEKNTSSETQIEGLQLVLNSPGTNGTDLTVTSGSAWIASLGASINVPSTLTGPSMTFSASTWYYVYLTSSSTLEISTTAPASPYKGDARAKAGDTSRRFIGPILTDAAGSPAVRPFSHRVSDHAVYYTGGTFSAPYRVLNAVGPGAANATANLSGIAPPGVTTETFTSLTVQVGSTLGLVYITTKLISGAILATVSSTGTVTNAQAGVPFWTPVIPATPSVLYDTSGPTGSTFYLDIYGYKFAR